MESKLKAKRFILKVIPGCIGPLLLIGWQVASWIQKETKMDFYHWTFLIVVMLSIGYGLYEFVVFLYRLWKQDEEVKNFEESLRKLQTEPLSRIEGDRMLGDRINKLQNEINNLNEAIEMMLPTLSGPSFEIPSRGHRPLSDKIREKLQKK
jgi:hypothetical protein